MIGDIAKAKELLDCFNETPDDLVFWSFRYFLGRTSARTCCFALDLAKAWPHLSQHIQTIIKRELDATFKLDDQTRDITGERFASTMYPLGQDCDRKAWEAVRAQYASTCANCGRIYYNCLCSHEED